MTRPKWLLVIDPEAQEARIDRYGADGTPLGSRPVSWKHHHDMITEQMERSRRLGVEFEVDVLGDDPHIPPHPEHGRVLAHVTLTTGHFRLSPRHEVADDIIPMLQDLSARSLESGEPVTMPDPLADHRLKVVRDPNHRAWTFHLECRGVPAVLGGVVDSVDAADMVWQLLSETTARLLGHAPEIPSPMVLPWCAAALVFLPPSPQHTSMYADFERCLAWALIEGEV